MPTTSTNAAASSNTPVPAARRLDRIPNLDEVRKTFAEDGYVIFRNVVPREGLERLRLKILEEFEKAKQSGQLFSGGGTIVGHLNCLPGEAARFAYEALEEHGIIDLLREFFPEATRLPNSGCNFNMAGSRKQHYHMDRNDFVHHFAIANVAVVDTDLKNGAMEIAPGTHKKFYKYWRFAVEAPYRSARRLEMKQGDVLVRDSNVWHRGMPNYTKVARPMLNFTWEDGGCAQGDPFSLEGGTVRFRQNWYSTGLAARVRERTYVAAPLSYSAYRFVTSLFDGSKGYDHQ